MTAQIRYTYVGQAGEFHFDIPARHLTDEDLALLSQEQVNQIKASPLYRAVPVATAPAVQAPAAQPSLSA